MSSASILSFTQPASAIGTITSGQATYSILSAAGAFHPTTFRPFGAASGSYLFEDFWAFNPGFSGTSLFFVTGETYAGDTATITIDNGQSPGTITYKIASTPTEVTLTSTISYAITGDDFSNTKLYYYSDIDAGAVQTNTATLVTSSQMAVLGAGHLVDFSADKASEYEAGAYPSVRDKVLSSPSQVLGNTGLPFDAGDFTGAYEWDFPTTNGVPITHSITYTVSIPEPACAAVMLAGLLAVSRRRLVRRIS